MHSRWWLSFNRAPTCIFCPAFLHCTRLDPPAHPNTRRLPIPLWTGEHPPTSLIPRCRHQYTSDINVSFRERKCGIVQRMPSYRLRIRTTANVGRHKGADHQDATAAAACREPMSSIPGGSSGILKPSECPWSIASTVRMSARCIHVSFIKAGERACNGQRGGRQTVTANVTS